MEEDNLGNVFSKTGSDFSKTSECKGIGNLGIVGLRQKAMDIEPFPGKNGKKIAFKYLDY